MKIFLYASVVVFSLFLPGCVSLGDPKQDANLKMFLKPTDKAGVYIYSAESKALLAGIVGIVGIGKNIYIDGKKVGGITSGTYLYEELVPGKHIIRAVGRDSRPIEIEAISGTLMFIFLHYSSADDFAPIIQSLHLMDERDGKEGVLKASLIETKD